jgi:hypothetical protein
MWHVNAGSGGAAENGITLGEPMNLFGCCDVVVGKTVQGRCLPKMPSRLEVFFLALMEELTEMPLTGTQPGPSSPLLFLRPTLTKKPEAE